MPNNNDDDQGDGCGSSKLPNLLSNTVSMVLSEVLGDSDFVPPEDDESGPHVVLQSLEDDQTDTKDDDIERIASMNIEETESTNELDEIHSAHRLSERALPTTGQENNLVVLERMQPADPTTSTPHDGIIIPNAIVVAQEEEVHVSVASSKVIVLSRKQVIWLSAVAILLIIGLIVGLTISMILSRQADYIVAKDSEQDKNNSEDGIVGENATALRRSLRFP